MNKKIISMAVAAALVAPVVAQAADINFSGDARYRWGQIQDSAGNTVQNAVDNRVRLKVDVKEDGISAHARIQLDNNEKSGDRTKSAVADYAYIKAPLFGGAATLSVGDQLATFGAGLSVNNDRKENRTKLAIPVGEALTVGLYADHFATATVDQRNNGGATVSAKVAGWKLAALSTDSETTIIYAKGKAGPVELTIENDSFKSKAAATMLMGKMPMGGMNIHFGYVGTEKGFTAHKLFNPVSTIGEDQKTGIMNLGNDAGDSTNILAGVDLKAGPGTLVAMFGTSNLDYGFGSADVTLMDLKYMVPLAKKAMLTATYGSLSGDFKATAFGANINYKF